MAANAGSVLDSDGDASDWIEIHNPDPVAITLAGWYLTDSANNKTKWQFPAVTIPPSGYLLVFASNKDRRDPAAQLHTNFALSAGGEYLGLIRADGTTVVHDYAPEFPAQRDNVSYGIPARPSGSSTVSYLANATPGAANGAPAAAPVSEEVRFSRAAGLFRNPFLLEMSGAGPSQHIRYVISSGSESTAEVSVTSRLYTGPVTIDRTSTVRAAAFSSDGGRGPTATIQFSKLGASTAAFSSQLPVMVIDSLGSGPLVKDQIDHPAWMYLYAAKANGAASLSGTPEVVSSLTASVRGSSSALFPKKGYNVKFTDESGDESEQALLGLPAFEKWALVAPWMYDLTYLNNAYVYSLSNSIGRWAPKTRFVEVFFNSGGDDLDDADYAGIYVLTDRVEVAEDRVEITSMSKKDVTGDNLTGGYLLKIDVADPDELSWRTPMALPVGAEAEIVLVSPKADDVAPEQVNYIQTFVQRMEEALREDQAKAWTQRTYLDYIDRASWVDFHILNVFVSNPDAFIRSTYFHKERNGTLKAGPVWDFDRAMGSHWDNRSQQLDVWFGVGSPDYWHTGWWGVIAEDPEFMQDWVDRWQTLRQTEFSPETLRNQMESLRAQIGNQAALRDATKWPESASPYGDHATTVKLIGDWMVQRADWIDSQFVAPPHVMVAGGSLIFTPPAGAQLAYTLDGSDPRSLGGEVAPNAELLSGPLTVPASANVHVRSYRADLREVFPGTPWSSAVGGDQSTPLSPAARLVNLSSRAIVGSGENALIAGVVVADTESKRYLSRGIGPGLATFGASGYVPDPQLSIFAENGSELFRNVAWETGVDVGRLPTYSRQVGAFPLAPGSRDSALASSMPGGNYTLQVTSPTGQNGIGLAELYELDTNGRTVNLSTRAYVHTDDGVLIGGFVVSGPAYKRMLVRAVGPTLGAFGVTNALRDPVLTIYSGSTVVRSNDQWQVAENSAAAATAMKRAGAFALASGSEDAALLITLPPGAYTVEVKGKAGGEGVALLEIYDVP